MPSTSRNSVLRVSPGSRLRFSFPATLCSHLLTELGRCTQQLHQALLCTLGTTVHRYSFTRMATSSSRAVSASPSGNQTQRTRRNRDDPARPRVCTPSSPAIQLKGMWRTCTMTSIHHFLTIFFTSGMRKWQWRLENTVCSSSKSQKKRVGKKQSKLDPSLLPATHTTPYLPTQTERSSQRTVQNKA